MRTWVYKILVILPVAIVSFLYLRILYYEQYSGTSSKRIIGLILSVALLFCWIVFVTIKRKQHNFLQVFIQGSFFVYVFAVLQLTGYFILFKEISSHDWWDKMDHRIKTHDHVNFEPFKTIDIYDKFDKQVAGNFIMLLPLGIYLPLLFRKLRKATGFFAVLFISLFISAGIEVLQLATSYRSTDIDDVILNTLGACLGFIIYLLLQFLITGGSKRAMANQYST